MTCDGELVQEPRAYSPLRSSVNVEPCVEGDASEDVEAASPASAPVVGPSVLRRATLALALLLLCAAPVAMEAPEELHSDSSWSSVTGLNEVHSGPKNRGVKVFQVLAQTSETCNDYPHLRLLKTLHNNLGGHGPDAGDEGLRYRAHLEGTKHSQDLIVDVHADSPYNPMYPEHNGLSSSAGQVRAISGGHSLSELCTGEGCDEAVSFGTINILPDSDVNFTFAFFDLDLQPLFLDEISLTWFDLDHNGCLGPQDCTPLAVESVTPRGDFSAYLSSTTQVKYKLAGERATFRASQRGDIHDNPITSILLTEEQMDKAVTSMYSKTHQLKVSLGATAGPTPRFFMFDFVPTLLCAETVKEWPPWMMKGGDEVEAAKPMTTRTSTSTSTPTTTTTSTTPGTCGACSVRVEKWAGRAGCLAQSGLCWVRNFLSWVGTQIKEVLEKGVEIGRKSICDAASGTASNEVDRNPSLSRHVKRMCNPNGNAVWQKTALGAEVRAVPDEKVIYS